MRTSIASGRYQASELDAILCPPGMGFGNVGHATKRGVLYLHGRAGDATAAIWPNDSNPHQGLIAQTIVEGGYPLVSVDAGGGTTWGNTTSRTRCSTAKTYMQSTLGARAGTIHVVGVSMGGLVALNWARANPSLVASVILVLPVLDPEYVRANNIGTAASEINTAYGGSYVDATEKATGNPSYYAGTGDLDTIPIQLWRATDDVYTPDAKYTQFDTDADLVELRSLGANGHTDTAINQIVWGDMITFLDGHN